MDDINHSCYGHCHQKGLGKSCRIYQSIMYSNWHLLWIVKNNLEIVEFYIEHVLFLGFFFVVVSGNSINLKFSSLSF